MIAMRFDEEINKMAQSKDTYLILTCNVSVYCKFLVKIKTKQPENILIIWPYVDTLY